MARLGLRQEHDSWMMMGGLIALCALVVVGVLVLPFFGPQIAAATAVVLVATIILICYGICVSPKGARRNP